MRIFHRTEENLTEASRLREMGMPYREISRHINVPARTIAYWFYDPVINKVDWGQADQRSADDILRAVHHELHIPPREVVGPWRTDLILKARFVVYYFMSNYTLLTSAGIARMIGGRNCHSVTNALTRIALDPEKYGPAIAAVAARLGVPVR